MRKNRVLTLNYFYCHYIICEIDTQKKSKSMQRFQNLKNDPHHKTMLQMEGCPLLASKMILSYCAKL